MEYQEIRLGGSGGQGIILMGIILAEAAIRSGDNAVQSQSYGPEARGGASKSEIIISEGDIDFPKVKEADIFLALTQEAFNKYIVDSKDDAIVIIDENIVSPNESAYRIYKAPILSTADDIFKKTMVTNIIALGVFNKVTSLMKDEVLKDVILKRVPKGTEDLNIQAYELGTNLIQI